MPGNETPIRIDHLDDAVDDKTLLEAFRSRAEETAEWREHRAWHEEDLLRRGDAAIVTSWDEPEAATLETPVRAASTLDEDAPVHRKREPLWAGCSCGSSTIKLLFGDEGITNVLPEQPETNAYGVAAANEAVSYLGNAPAGGVTYHPGQAPPNVSYKPD